MYAVIIDNSLYETRYFQKREDAVKWLKKWYEGEIQLALSFGAEVVYKEIDDKHLYILERNKYIETEEAERRRGYRTMTLFEGRIEEFDLE